MTSSYLKKQVEDLFDTFNDIAQMLGKETGTKKTATVTDKGKVGEMRMGDEQVCTAIWSKIYLLLSVVNNFKTILSR